MEESTQISRCFAEQGLKIRIRRDIRMRKYVFFLLLSLIFSCIKYTWKQNKVGQCQCGSQKEIYRRGGRLGCVGVRVRRH
jgi:hypothetical protein